MSLPAQPRRANESAWIVVTMIAMVAIPAGITLHSVRAKPLPPIIDFSATPYGYTWSLLLFIVPITVIVCWFLPSESLRIPKRAFWRTISILIPLGFALDFFFASKFFCFPNKGATLGILAPALGGGVPVEEYVFYFTGFIAILLIYIWLNEYWLAAYGVRDYQREAKAVERLLRFHPSSLVAAVLLIGAAILYKRFSAYPHGFPGYFTVLVIGGLAPSISFFPSTCRFINWRAFSLTLFMVLLISMFWEATLAAPYGWWGYQQNQMMGLFIGAWAGLPIEAVVVWLAVTYATTIVFEAVTIWQASEKDFRHALLGKPIRKLEAK